MLVSNVSFTSSIRNNNTNIDYDCNGCGKRKVSDYDCVDTYVRNVEADNQNLKKALRFACKIIAANE